MARVNIYILGINKLKWTGMGEFNSDDHYIYYCGQKSLRRNGVAIIVNKRVWNAVFGFNLKNDRMISVHFQGKPINIMVIQVYSPTSNSEEALWRPTRPFRTNIQERRPFQGLECKSRKSRNNWSNRQIWPWSTEWSKAKAHIILPREHTDQSKHPLPATRDNSTHGITRWSIPKSDWLYALQSKMEKLYTVSKTKTGSWLWLRSVQFTRSVMSNSLQCHEPQDAKTPCPSPTPRVYPSSCPLSQWCHHPLLSPSPPAFNHFQHTWAVHQHPMPPAPRRGVQQVERLFSKCGPIPKAKPCSW